MNAPLEHVEMLTGEIALVPHMTIDPNRYRTGKKQKHVPPKQRSAYWNETFQELGIAELKRVSEDSYRVPLSSITDPRILETLGREPRTEAGVSLTHAGQVMIGAQCCSELTARFWQEALLAMDEKKWEMVWIGHPWVYIRRFQDQVLLTGMQESEPQGFKDARYAIPLKTLQKAVQVLKAEILAFETRLKSVVP